MQSEEKGLPMNGQIFKGLRLPPELIRKIEAIAKADGSTFSQFMRTAAIREVKRRQIAA